MKDDIAGNLDIEISREVEENDPDRLRDLLAAVVYGSRVGLWSRFRVTGPRGYVSGEDGRVTLASCSSGNLFEGVASYDPARAAAFVVGTGKIGIDIW